MPALTFIKELLIATLNQMASLLAGVFIFGLLIQLVSQLTFRILEKAFGPRGVYLVAWLGTPVHEIGHIIFCVIFLHRIAAVELFKPDPLTGTLGYVHHTWSRSNPWQVIGNFFIGIGPVVVGVTVLFAFFYLLVPEAPRVWNEIMSIVTEANGNFTTSSYLKILGESSLILIGHIFTLDNLTNWRFWVFCYLSICIASNVRLSPADIKGSLSGLFFIIFLFLVINGIGLVTGISNEALLPLTASSLGIIYGLFVLALIMAGLGLILTYAVGATYYRLRYRLILKPF